MTDDTTKPAAPTKPGMTREQRHAELMEQLKADPAFKVLEPPGMTRAQLDALMAKLAKNPQCEIMPPSNTTFIIPMPGGIPKAAPSAAEGIMRKVELRASRPRRITLRLLNPANINTPAPPIDPRRTCRAQDRRQPALEGPGKNPETEDSR